MSDSSALTDVLSLLEPLLGERLSTDVVAREAHAADVSHHVPAQPEAVCWPVSTEEVAQVVKACAEHGVVW